MAEKIAVATLIVLLAAGIVGAETAPALPSAPGKDGKGAVRLEEVRITGSPEHPGVLFFLPRARFHLLPLRTERNAAEGLLREDREKGALLP